MKYFISDIHAGHKNILKFERTQFSTIEEHDNYIVEKVNSVVKVTDELYILGDIGDLEVIRRLNGRKYLILGNHDRESINKYRAYFAEVYQYPIYLKENIILSHIPVPVTDEVLNVHGHLHGANIDDVNYLNLSAHMINYTPVSEDQLYLLASRLPKKNIRFLEEWYAEKYIFERHEDRTDVVTDEFGRIKLAESRKLRDLVRDPSGYKIDVFPKSEN